MIAAMEGRARKGTTNTAAWGSRGSQGTVNSALHPAACSNVSLFETTESPRRGQYCDSPGFTEVSTHVCICASQCEKLNENG